ncbi:hypothetical protein SBC1_14370 [Caballeronia sp. SBC1]|nr:hypothetical protein SBC2_15760 [Caballeronia sp. SBC2]QIN61445.1 hypothetical protein SBC1_14370 [Caballeronia sp. SBC1]
MWIAMNDSFLSIVDAAQSENCLLVRARREGDIEAVFPAAKVVIIIGRDYRFRAEIDRQEVGAVVAARLISVSYPNFKSSVKDRNLVHAYHEVWRCMEALQPVPAYGTKPRPGFRAQPKR